MKKLLLLFTTITLVACCNLQSQVLINTTGGTPDASSMLDIQSTDMGLLIPRMTEAERDLITTPATGLMIFQTDVVPGFYFYNSTSNWQYIRIYFYITGINPINSQIDLGTLASCIFVFATL